MPASIGISVLKIDKIFIDGHRGSFDVESLESHFKLFPIRKGNPRTQVNLSDACNIVIINFSLFCKHAPFALVEPPVVLVREHHPGELAWVFAGAIDSGNHLVVVHPHKSNLGRKRFQETWQAVSYADACKLVGIVCPHQLVIVDLAEGAQSGLCLVVPNRVSDCTVSGARSQEPAGSKEPFHGIVEIHVGGAEQIALANSIELAIKVSQRAVSVESAGLNVRFDGRHERTSVASVIDVAGVEFAF